MSDKIKTLSEAIRYGSTFLGESLSFFDCKDDVGRYTAGCALGTAYLAVINRDEQYPVSPHDICAPLRERFDVPKEVLEEVSWHHFQGRLNRSQCADWLESKGY